MTAQHNSPGLGTLWKFSREGDLIWHRDTQAEEPAEAYWSDQPDERKPEETSGKATRVLVDQLTRDVVVLHSHSRVMQEAGKYQNCMWSLRRYNKDGDLLHSWSDRPHGLDRRPDAYDRRLEPQLDKPVHLRFMPEGHLQITFRRDVIAFDGDGQPIPLDEIEDGKTGVKGNREHCLVTLDRAGNIIATAFPMLSIADAVYNDPAGTKFDAKLSYRSYGGQTLVISEEGQTSTPWWRGDATQVRPRNEIEERHQSSETLIGSDAICHTIRQGDGLGPVDSMGWFGTLAEPLSDQGITHLSVPKFRFGNVDPTTDTSRFSRWNAEALAQPFVPGPGWASLPLLTYLYAELFISIGQTSPEPENVSWQLWAQPWIETWFIRCRDKLTAYRDQWYAVFMASGTPPGLSPDEAASWSVWFHSLIVFLENSQLGPSQGRFIIVDYLWFMQRFLPAENETTWFGDYERDPYQDDWTWADRLKMDLAALAPSCTYFDELAAIHFQPYRTNFRVVGRRTQAGWKLRVIKPQTIKLLATNRDDLDARYGVPVPDADQLLNEYRAIGGLPILPPDRYIGLSGDPNTELNNYWLTDQLDRNVSIDLGYLPPIEFLSDEGTFFETERIRWPWLGAQCRLGGLVSDCKVGREYLLILPPREPQRAVQVHSLGPAVGFDGVPLPPLTKYGGWNPVPEFLRDPVYAARPTSPPSIEQWNQAALAEQIARGDAGSIESIKLEIEQPNPADKRWLLLRTDDLSEVTTGLVADHQVPIVAGQVIPLRDDGIGLTISGGWIYSAKTGKRMWRLDESDVVSQSIDEHDSSIYFATQRRTQPPVTFLRHPERI